MMPKPMGIPNHRRPLAASWERELEEALEIQKRLFPRTPTRIQGVDYAGICRPAMGVSGDCYDFIPLGPQKLGLFLADVSGKGLAAALLGAALHGVACAHARTAGEDSGEVLAHVNRLLFESLWPDKFATAFYGVYDASTQILTYANAGHPAPLLFSGETGTLEPVKLNSLTVPVGLQPKLPPVQGSVALAPGDWLLIFSDGILEACGDSDEQFGYDNLLRLMDWPHTTASEVCKRIIEAVTAFTPGVAPADDLTVIAVNIERGKCSIGRNGSGYSSLQPAI